MGYKTPSGTADFVPFESGLILDALERAEIYAPEMKHMHSARRSAQLLLSSKWSNRGINLWKIDREPTAIPLIQGIASYDLTADIVGMFDTYRRQYQMNGGVSMAPDFSTVLGSPNVVVGGISAAVGNYVSFPVHIAAGGLIIYGFYQVIATPTATSVTIKARALATATVNNGGVTAVFTTAAASNTINVELPNNGLLPGQPFVVGVSTTVSGVQIFGSYPVQAVVDADNFTIDASNNAFGVASGAENNGQAQIATQNVAVSPQDIFMGPLSRTDYAGQTNKQQQGQPSTYWYQKLILPRVTVWPVPDNNGPYELRGYMLRQIQDFNASGGETPDLPNRMWWPFVCDLAADLCFKFNAKKYADAKTVAEEAWEEASSTDVENTSSYILPNLPDGLN